MPDELSGCTPNRLEIPVERALRLLKDGQWQDTYGLLPWSSNYTFLMTLTDRELERTAVYKPRRGERPLWDFPDGTLCQREVAAYLISEALGWHIVPPTLLRAGPHGIGSVQWFIDHDPEQNYFTFGAKLRPQLMRIALFDHLLNNADRKGGHCLRSQPDGAVLGIDHGLTFHPAWKLRTVIWDFAGERIDAKTAEDVCRVAQFDAGITDPLGGLLSPLEIEALQQRAAELLTAGVLPEPDEGYHSVPWPLV